MNQLSVVWTISVIWTFLKIKKYNGGQITEGLLKYNILAKSKLVQLNFENNSLSVYNVFIYAVCYKPWCILISDLVVANLFMHSLPGMILLYLAMSFYTKGVFAWDLPIIRYQITQSIIKCTKMMHIQANTFIWAKSSIKSICCYRKLYQQLSLLI